MSDYIQVSTTTENREDAAKIARAAVEKRLAACAQIMGPISSTYRWKEKIQEEEEWLCLMKTREGLYEGLEKVIRDLHPYEEPEIVAVPIVAGSQGYLDWLGAETS